MATEAAPVGPIADDLVENIILPEETVSTWTLAMRRLRRHRLAMFGLAVLVVMITASLLAPILAPYPYDAIDLQNRLSPPSRAALVWH